MVFCGVEVAQDVQKHLRCTLENIPENKIASPDTLLRLLTELAAENTIINSTSRKQYEFNINELLGLKPNLPFPEGEMLGLKLNHAFLEGEMLGLKLNQPFLEGEKLGLNLNRPFLEGEKLGLKLNHAFLEGEKLSLKLNRPFSK